MAFEIEVKTSAFSSATFYIDENLIKFDNKEVTIKNITGFGYMSTQNSVNGINTTKTFEIRIWQEAEKLPTILRFMGAFGGSTATEKYLTLTDQLWTYFGDKMLKKLHQELKEGTTIEFASNLKLVSKGIVIRRKPLFGTAYEVIAPWNEIALKPFRGLLDIKCTTNKKAKTTEFLKDKNVWLLYYYIDWLANNPDVTALLMAVPNNYRLIEKS